MMRTASVAAQLFAATFVAIGVIGLVRGDFAPVWQPVPKGVPAREVWVYLSAILSLTCGLGLLWRRTAALAARVLFASLLIWFAAFRIPVLFHAPLVEVSWEGGGETAVILAGAWVLVGRMGMRPARVLFGLALIPLGLAHLAYLKLTASLVPAWLPYHAAWAVFTGCAYVAAGVAVIVDVFAGLASLLAALQMGLFTVLVWVPILARGPRDPSEWSEGLISWALTAAALVVASSYRWRRSGTRQPFPL